MTGCPPIRVMIVDDHTMVRRGLATVLRTEPDCELVGEAGDGLEALALCEQIQPDVILMDLVMPRMDGRLATQAILERWPDIRIIVLTSFREKELVQGALQAGAIGYLLKTITTEELLLAIRAAQAGRQTLAPEAVQILQLAKQLEEMSHALVAGPADGSSLPELLARHVPAILPDCCVEIRGFPDQVLLAPPTRQPPLATSMWDWLQTQAEPHVFPPLVELPWGGSQPADMALVAVPILEPGGSVVMGGISAMSRRDGYAAAELLPALQAVAMQVASALHGANVYGETQRRQRVARELALAAQVQASFLPDAPPLVPGWQIAATLETAEETSGDFYDFVPLPGGRLGVLVADVADKGMAAALYMALCRTLIRTFAAEYDQRPALALAASNRRMLQDARTTWFVTACYGVLEPATGAFTYCNAGHNPPLLLHAAREAPPTWLAATGMALGVTEGATWQEHTTYLQPGDVLVIYTDGVTDAQNRYSEFFGEDRMLEAARSSTDQTAADIIATLLESIRCFGQGMPQFDDITLSVVKRTMDTYTPRLKCPIGEGNL